MKRGPLALFIAPLCLALAAAPAFGIDDEHTKKANAVIEKGIAYLRTKQEANGSWVPKYGPAITGFVAQILLDQPGIKRDDPAVEKAIAYIKSKAREDGGIHEGTHENYNTSICLSALSRVNNEPGMKDIIKKAQDYLRNIQSADKEDSEGNKIDENHPWYGGQGYGPGESRPDLSNVATMIQALHDSGLDCNDPAYQRALVFITRCQGTSANKMYGDKIVPNGGAVYAPSQGKGKMKQPESKAGAEKDSGLMVPYGSMSYAMFKCYLYAQLKRDDIRVQDAMKFIRSNYTLDQNVGLPEDHKMEGYYNGLMAMSQAFKAWGEKTLTTADGKTHDWANELIDKLASLQKEDGSFVNTAAGRWEEGNPILCTCYALIALQTAAK